MLIWAKCSPVQAISLLCPRLHNIHPLTLQYAVRVLRSYSSDVLLQYIPQIVQAVRWDTVRVYEKYKPGEFRFFIEIFRWASSRN